MKASVPCRVAHPGGTCAQCAADRRDPKRIAQSISGGCPSAICRCWKTWPQLYVEDDDVEAALRAPWPRAAAAAPTGVSWICEHCGEVLEPQFTSCWRCGSKCIVCAIDSWQMFEVRVGQTLT